jgi:hypothetical protein
MSYPARISGCKIYIILRFMQKEPLTTTPVSDNKKSPDCVKDISFEYQDKELRSESVP